MHSRMVWSQCLALLIGMGTLAANPQSPHVVAGTVSFSTPNPFTLRVNASDGSIIDWNSFSIAPGEITKFQQPTPNAAVLNRVIGMSPSAIQGALQANGKVLLINQNGILISASGLINTSSFIASTLDVLNSEFLAQGDMQFSGSSNEQIFNVGSINGWNGDVVLISRFVNHSGEMNAPLGTAAIGAGTSVLLRATGNERIYVSPSMAPPMPTGDGIYSAGLITAIQSELKASGNLYSMAINVTGYIDAVGFDMKEGRIVLQAEGGTTRLNGTLHAVNDSGWGGEIHVLGSSVTLESGAVVDASNYGGGGTILIGGNTPGSAPVVYNAEETYVGNGAMLTVSASADGDGGVITVWSDSMTQYDGFASAEGGSIGGSGGEVNIGSRGSLQITGNGSTLAPYGAIGWMNIEAEELFVAQGALPMPPLNTIDSMLLSDNLYRNQVQIFTRSGGPATADIQFVGPFSWFALNRLLVQSAHDVRFGADLSYNGANPVGYLVARAANDIFLNPVSGSMAIAFPSSSLSLYADRDIVAAGGMLDGASIAVSGDLLHFEAGRDMRLLGGSGNGAYIDVDGIVCKFDVQGYLHTEGGAGAVTDVHVQRAEIISHGN